MRNIKHHIYTLIVVVFVLTGGIISSCQKDIDETIDLNAVIDDNSGKNAKVVIDNARYACWSNDDTVSINGEKYLVSVGTTSGTTTAKIAGVTKNDNGYAAVYPYSCHDNESAGLTTATIKLPDVQKWSSTHITTPMVAYTTGSTLTFHNPCNLLEVTLTNTTGNELQVHQIIVSSSNTKLSGTATITGIDGATPTVSSITGGTNDVTLDCDDAVLGTSSSLTFYVTVPKCSGEQFRFRVLAKNGSTKYTFDANSQSGITLSQNQMVPIAVTLSSSTPNTTADFWGSGTSSNPYLITCSDDLRQLKSLMGTSEDATYNASGIYYRQTVDIDATSSSWDNTDNYLYATYDGGNHTTKLSLSMAGGFVARMCGGCFKNLTLEGTCASTSTSTIGAFANYVWTGYTGVFENCTNKIAISGGANTGGFVGLCRGTSVTFTNCKNNANISGGQFTGGFVGEFMNGTITLNGCSNSNPVSGAGYVGGMVGGYNSSSGTLTIKGITTNEETATITSSAAVCGGIVGGGYFNITVSSGATVTNNAAIKTTNNASVGGIVGACNTSFNATGAKLINNGTVTSKTNYAGGIIGYATVSCTLSVAKNYKTITGTYGIGGIVGYISGKIIINDTAINEGTVEGSGGAHVGGIIGYCTTCKLCSIESGCIINDATVTGVGSASANNSGIGGIIGTLNTSNANNSIYRAWNKKKVSSSAGGGVGGILGRAVQCTIDHCKNTGDIDVKTGGSYSAAGGIVGISNGGKDINIYNCGVECANICTATVTTNRYTGGIVGYGRDNYNITNCYAQVTSMFGSSSTASPYGSAAGVFGLLCTSNTVKMINVYTYFYANSGNKIRPTIHKTNGTVTTTYTYSNSTYKSSPEKTVNSAGYPTAYFNTSGTIATDGDDPLGSFYTNAQADNNSTVGDALRNYRKYELNEGNDEGDYLAWTSDDIPKLNWTGIW